MLALRSLASILIATRWWYWSLGGTGCEGWSPSHARYSHFPSFRRGDTTRRDSRPPSWRPTAAATSTTRTTTSSALGSSRRVSNDSGDDWSVGLRQRLEEQTRHDLVRASFGGDVPLTQVRLVGQAVVPAGIQKPPPPAAAVSGGVGRKGEEAAAPAPRGIPCAVLAASNSQDSYGSASAAKDEPRPCLLVPLAAAGNGSGGGRTRNNAGAKLLEFVAHKQILSKSLLLQLNGLVVNRDDSLFDNLPWSSWTVDPQLRNRDAANNPVRPKFHLGKRDAYNRMMGKDWKGKSLALGNLAARLRHAIEVESDDAEEDAQEEEAAASLAERILQLQIKEQEMVVADLDYQLAIGRQRMRLDSENSDTTAHEAMLTSLLEEREAAGEDLQSMQQQLEQLTSDATNDKDNQSRPSHALAQLFEDVASRVDQNNEAPYRGATGYAPRIDTVADVQEGLSGAYCSPYDLLREIIGDQLNAEVIGAILENTSLLDGTVSVGGAVVLRRKTTVKSVTIAGEQLKINDDEEDFGNAGVTGGQTVLVECDAEEAIGLAMACSVPLQVESNVLERGSVMMQRTSAPFDDPTNATTVRDALPFWSTRDPLLSVLVAGQATNQSATGRVAPLRIPRTTTSLFDSLFEPRSSPPASSGPNGMFPTDNPIQSLDEFDRLTTEDKARTLMTISNFEGRLPRPRVVKQSPEVLDQLLLPLIDESTRRQYRIREAKRQGNEELVRELERQKSQRQATKEKAELARELGADAEAERWENEAELYASLRADVTQDEGSYSRFLDRDEWYERQRAQQAKKLDKRKFGTLLDGVE